MISNQKSLDKTTENLPVLSSNERVRKNSMRLYTYLVCLSSFNGKDKPRRLHQKDIRFKSISDDLGMKYETLRKYWKILEETEMVKYCGPRGEEINWDKNFMARKKYINGYYELDKKDQYRIIPEETLTKMRTKLCVSEAEFKFIYLWQIFKKLGLVWGMKVWQLPLKKLEN